MKKKSYISTCFFVILTLSVNLYSEDNKSAKSTLFNSITDVFYLYQNIRFSIDKGLNYQLSQCEGQNYKVYNTDTLSLESRESDDIRKLYSNEDKGYSADFQYIIGYGILEWDKRPLCGIGLMTDTKFMYSSDSSFYSFGIGIDMKFLWILNHYCGIGYAGFNRKLPVLDRYEISNTDPEEKPVFDERYINGPVVFFGMGIDYPIDNQYSVFVHINAYFFDVSNNNTTGYWVRNGLDFGVAYNL